MIIPMKKVSLLIYHKERDSFLQSLQDLGAVHIVDNPEIISDDLTKLQNTLKASDDVLKSLKKIEKESGQTVSQKTEGNAEEIIQQFETYKQQLEKVEQNIVFLQKDCKALKPWGDFEYRTIEKLKSSSVHLRFFELSEKKFELLVKDNLYYEVIGRQSGTVYFIVIERDEKISIEADEVHLPKISLCDAEKNITRLESEKEDVKKSLEGLIHYQDLIERYIRNNTESKDYEAARLNLHEAAEGKILSLTGWLPKNKEKDIAQFLDGFSAWYQFSEPTKDDVIPVKLKNKKTWKVFEPILRIYSLPDYFEIDPTPFFAPFYAFFFGLCLADLGYGFILILVSLIGLAKAPKKFHSFMHLGLLLGLCTLVGGFILNTFFGHPIFAAPGAETGYFKSGIVWAILNPVVTDAGTYFPAMPFAMYIGIFQILVGTLIKMLNEYRNNGIMYILHPVSSFLMIIGLTIILAKIDFIDMGKFALGSFNLGPILTTMSFQFANGITFTGLAMLFLFNNPDKNIFVRLGLGFWELYNFGSGLMGDALSYLRLFALGLAGGLLGAAFNQIAFMFILAKDGTVNYATPMVVFTILVLIVGHALNFILAALGSFVHPLRLTFVEFYNNINFKGGGKPFHPFSKAVK